MSDAGEQKARALLAPPVEMPARTPIANEQAAKETADDFDDLDEEHGNAELSAAWAEIDELKSALCPFADAGRRLHVSEGGTVASALRFITPEELRAAWRALEYIP